MMGQYRHNKKAKGFRVILGLFVLATPDLFRVRYFLLKTIRIVTPIRIFKSHFS